jgi:hypothetical protein
MDMRPPWTCARPPRTQWCIQIRYHHERITLGSGDFLEDVHNHEERRSALIAASTTASKYDTALAALHSPYRAVKAGYRT